MERRQMPGEVYFVETFGDSVKAAICRKSVVQWSAKVWNRIKGLARSKYNNEPVAWLGLRTFKLWHSIKDARQNG